MVDKITGALAQTNAVHQIMLIVTLFFPTVHLQLEEIFQLRMSLMKQ